MTRTYRYKDLKAGMSSGAAEPNGSTHPLSGTGQLKNYNASELGALQYELPVSHTLYSTWPTTII